jgi:uncharacterized protein YciI
MKNTFVAISSAGPNRDFSKGTREQPFWDEHAKFIDQLVDDGFILMGGPLVDEGGALLIVNAEDENEVREKLKNDPWAERGILKLERVKRWEIFIDQRTGERTRLAQNESCFIRRFPSSRFSQILSGN